MSTECLHSATIKISQPWSGRQTALWLTCLVARKPHWLVETDKCSSKMVINCSSDIKTLERNARIKRNLINFNILADVPSGSCDLETYHHALPHFSISVPKGMMRPVSGRWSKTSRYFNRSKCCCLLEATFGKISACTVVRGATRSCCCTSDIHWPSCFGPGAPSKIGL